MLIEAQQAMKTNHIYNAYWSQEDNCKQRDIFWLLWGTLLYQKLLRLAPEVGKSGNLSALGSTGCPGECSNVRCWQDWSLQLGNQAISLQCRQTSVQSWWGKRYGFEVMLLPLWILFYIVFARISPYYKYHRSWGKTLIHIHWTEHPDWEPLPQRMLLSGKYLTSGKMTFTFWAHARRYTSLSWNSLHL